MGTGLVIGKFMPLHNGHMGMINFAAENCERLIVLLGAKKDEPIPGPLRLKWLRETFSGNSRIIIEYTDDDLPDSTESSRSVSKVWAEYLKTRFPSVTRIFSSEKYGDYLAEYMGIEHMYYDIKRNEFAVTATKIREEPFVYWDYISEAAKPYFRKKICIYGPESTGKSTMVEKLASFYNTNFVPEVARDIIGDEPVVYDHIPVIAEAHANEILKQEKVSNRILFVDSDIITTRIYSEFYFQKVPEFPEWIEEVNQYDMYLFFEIDTPWVDDPQRDSEHLREEHRAWFQKELDDRGIPFTLISGGWEERFIKCREAIEGRWEFPESIVY